VCLSLQARVTGLGLAIAELLVSKGKKVTSISRTQPKLGAIGWIETDLMVEASIENAAIQILKGGEPIEALINCAAVTSYEDMDTITPDELERMFKTNVTAPILLTSNLLNRLKQPKNMEISEVIVNRKTRR
jgi:short-subunit dehydrogenase